MGTFCMCSWLIPSCHQCDNRLLTLQPSGHDTSCSNARCPGALPAAGSSRLAELPSALGGGASCEERRQSQQGGICAWRD